MHLLSQLTDNALLELAVSESVKLVPYITSSRRTVKLYLKVSVVCLRIFPAVLRVIGRKTCLNLWSSAEDDIRIAAFLAIRKLAMSTDESMLNMVLKVSCDPSPCFVCAG